MKITQKLFKEKLSRHKSIFVGRTKSLLTPDELECAFDKDFDASRCEQREIIGTVSTRLIFTGGSQLDLHGCNCHEYSLSHGTVLVCEDSWVSMYYLLAN